METQKLRYRDGDGDLEGTLVYDGGIPGKRPLVLVAHAWAGQSDLERGKAAKLAELGYVGFALDMYGRGVLGKDAAENSALMTPFMEDRALLRRRIQAGLAAARAHELVDPARVGAIGFCFGGLCVLDLARSGAELTGVVSFHGLLGAPGLGDNPERISAKVLALHGHDDPMVQPDKVAAFAAEMTGLGVDWQVHVYGGTMHAFTNPAANDPGFGTVYSARADRRSWAAMTDFFAEIFAA